MGYKELIESLHKEGEEKIRLQWVDVEAEAEQIRNETSRRIKEMKEEYGIKRQVAQKEQEVNILGEAKKKARSIRLLAENRLSDRLFLLALSCLSELRTGKYESIFDSLVKELPDTPWKEVKVCSEDLKLAAQYFTGAHVIPDKGITGGFLAYTEDKKIQVDNTFEKRLERRWEDILPVWIKDIVSEASHNVTSSAT